MPDDCLKVLILGGYGTFGGRLATLLAGAPQTRLLVAGRSLAKASAFCAGLPGGADAIPLALDRDDRLGARLAEIRPDLLVDATGPFQGYADEPYRVVRACLAQGIDYLDFADGSAFVAGIDQFDSEARAKEIFVLSGVSSFPVLTAAVVAELSGDFTRIDSVTGGIAPSPYAGVGLNVIRALAGYAGKPVEMLCDGQKTTGYALTGTMRKTIAPPGRLPLRNLLFSLVDVPDLRALPAEWPALRSVWMGAGPVPEVLHRCLIGLAWLVRLRLVPSLLPLAPLFHRIINHFTWGEHRGGMFVVVRGETRIGPIERSWHLLAEGDDGPLIPSMACEAVIRRCLAGRRPPPGARAATRALSLADYDALFARRNIFTGIRENRPGDRSLPLYRRLLGEAFASLPQPIRSLHDLTGSMTARGFADVDRGRGPLAWLAATLFRFPRAGRDVPVEVRFGVRDGAEAWERIFAGHAFVSVAEEGRGRLSGLLAERFGPLTFGLALVVEDDVLWLVVRRWSFLGIRLPLALAPRSRSHESVENGRFVFHVEITLPLIGLIVRYRGWLVPEG